jgi:PAS domain S-box-containing protein
VTSSKIGLAHSLDEARQTLDAISQGHVDAVVVHGPQGPQLFRLEGPEQPFRTFVERMQEGALTLSRDGTILYANSFFGKLVARPLEAVIGAPLSRFVAPGYASTLAELVRQGIEGTVKGECRLEVNGATLPVQLTLGPLNQESCCVVLFDLRERELAEEAYAARAVAEESTRAKDRFLAVLSHELRSPLNTMLGWAQILTADASLDGKARRAAEAILRGARTQAQLIGDLLDISRIVAGKLDLEKEQLDFTALAEGAIAGVEPLANERHVTLAKELAATDAAVYGDETRLQQILANLLNNALKYTEPGGHIAVSLVTDEDHVTLCVADSGIGMSRELVAHVFEVFHQGGPLERRQGGLGLGLAIAKQLADAHGGTLEAMSAGEGKGSTFVLRLPRAKRSNDAHGAFSPAGELTGVRALVVDDDPDALGLTRYVLERAGATAVTASSAAAALVELAKGEIDLVISDLGLPDQDGLALMREIRARGHDGAKLPAMAVTGYAGSYEQRLVFAAGYQKMLAKPVDATALVRAAAELTRG